MIYSDIDMTTFRILSHATQRSVDDIKEINDHISYRKPKKKKERNKMHNQDHVISSPNSDIVSNIKPRIDWPYVFDALDHGVSAEDLATKFETTVGVIKRLYGKHKNQGKNKKLKSQKPNEYDNRINNILSLIRSDDSDEVKIKAKELIIVMTNQVISKSFKIDLELME